MLLQIGHSSFPSILAGLPFIATWPYNAYTIPNVKTTNLFAIFANLFCCCSAREGDYPVFRHRPSPWAKNQLVCFAKIGPFAVFAFAMVFTILPQYMYDF